MPLFSFSAINASGREVSGWTHAADSATLQQRCQSKGWSLRSVRPLSWRQGLDLDKKCRLFSELGALLEADVALNDALDLLSLETAQEQGLLQTWKTGIQAGKSLSRCIRESNPNEDHLVLKMLEVGEASGELGTAARQIARYYEALSRIRSKVVTALMYPCLVLVVTIAAVAVLTLYVIPMFLTLFARYQLELPLATRILTATTDFFGSGGWLILPASAALLLFGRHRGWHRRPWFFQVIDRIPFLGPFLRTLRILNVTQSLANLLTAQVRIHEAVHLLVGLTPDPRLDRELTEVAERVLKGDALSAAMRGRNLLPERELRLVRIGEETGRLADQFHFLAEQYQNRLWRSLDRFTSLFEPLLIVFLSLVIGGILIALYVPLFDILSGATFRH